VPPRDPELTRVTPVDESAKKGQEPPKPAGDACIVVIYGTELGKRLELGAAPFEIGRSSNNDLFIDQESVSRHHARITYVDGKSILKFMTGENVEVHYHEEIYRLMTVDGLTQIFNRRYFNEALEREVNRAKRYSRALSLLAFDIDLFKKVNDTYGHLAGDSLLRVIAAAVKSRLRREDILARTGGEEFAVLLPEVTLEGALVTAEKVRALVEATPVKHDQDTLRCTISLGVAELVREDAAPEDLYKRADERLFEAKQGGRNCVKG